MAHQFFTGPSCAGCNTAKQLIEAKSAEDQFEFIDVEEQALRALQAGVRSLPTVITDDYQYHVGTADVMKFIKRL